MSFERGGPVIIEMPPEAAFQAPEMEQQPDLLSHFADTQFNMLGVTGTPDELIGQGCPVPKEQMTQEGIYKVMSKLLAHNGMKMPEQFKRPDIDEQQKPDIAESLFSPKAKPQQTKRAEPQPAKAHVEVPAIHTPVKTAEQSERITRPETLSLTPEAVAEPIKIEKPLLPATNLVAERAAPPVTPEVSIPIEQLARVQMPEIPPLPAILPLPVIRPATAAEVMPFVMEAEQKPHPEISLPQPTLPETFTEVFEPPTAPEVIAAIYEAPLPANVLADTAYRDLGWETPVQPSTITDEAPPDLPPIITNELGVPAWSEVVAAMPVAEQALTVQTEAPETTEQLMPFTPTVAAFAESLMLLSPAVPAPEASVSAAETTESIPVVAQPEAMPAVATTELPPAPQEVAIHLQALSPPEKVAMAPLLEAITTAVSTLQEQIDSGEEPEPVEIEALQTLSYRLFETLGICAEPQRIAAFIQTLTNPQFLQVAEAAMLRLEHEGTHERKLHLVPLNTIVSFAVNEVRAVHSAIGSFAVFTTHPRLRPALA